MNGKVCLCLKLRFESSEVFKCVNCWVLGNLGIPRFLDFSPPRDRDCFLKTTEIYRFEILLSEIAIFFRLPRPRLFRLIRYFQSGLQNWTSSNELIFLVTLAHMVCKKAIELMSGLTVIYWKSHLLGSVCRMSDPIVKTSHRRLKTTYMSDFKLSWHIGE